jgi:zinc and cadmium transporter
MSTLAWIIVSGLLMNAVALVGSVTLVLPERLFERLVLPLVALAAGSLLGGALFHMLPESVEAIGNHLAVYGWLAAGLFAFFALEQFLHWHHCHRPPSADRPLGYLVLLADGLHNLLDGLAVGSAFVIETRRGS